MPTGKSRFAFWAVPRNHMSAFSTSAVAIPDIGGVMTVGFVEGPVSVVDAVDLATSWFHRGNHLAESVIMIDRIESAFCGGSGLGGGSTHFVAASVFVVMVGGGAGPAIDTFP